LIKTVLLLSAAMLAATPAAAQNANFIGPRVEVNTGMRDVNHDDAMYGLGLGVDAPLGNRATVGVDADAQNVFDHNGRDFGVGARLGFALNRNILAYGRVGYTNLDTRHGDLDGYTVGGGVNLALTPASFVNVEYRRSDYGHNVDSDGVRLGVGFRF
jgi:outer membrane immunogenic protein